MATCSSADSVIEAASQIKSNATKLNTFVNGTASQTVQLGAGDPTPVLRKLVADAQDIIALAANDAAETALDAIAANTQNKADKFVPADPGNLAMLNSEGNLRDSRWAAEDFVHLLVYANSEALELAWQNRMAIKHYYEWIDEKADRDRRDHQRGVDFLGYASNEALAAQQRVQALIDAFDESYAQHRLQIRLFNGTNPASSSKPVVFVISGQSNGQGSAIKTYARAVDCGWYWAFRNGENELRPIADPVGAIGPRGGSGWPAFAKLFFHLTGRKVIIVNLAYGGSTVTDDGSTTSNTWADNQYGVRRSWAQTAWNGFTAVAPEYDLGGIFWIQGETDASRIYAGTVDISDYKNGTEDVLGWFRTLVGDASCPIFMGVIGFNWDAQHSNASLRAVYEAVQAVQLELCDYETIFPGFSMTPYFGKAWNVFYCDGVHYTSIGYEYQGKAFARSAVNYLNF